MTKEEEKRRFPRLGSLQLTFYLHFDKSDSPDAMGMGRTLDLSQGGAMIQTHRSFQVETGLEMTIALEETLVATRGRVVHVREIGDGTYEMGVCFTKLEEADRRALAEFFGKISAD